MNFWQFWAQWLGETLISPVGWLVIPAVAVIQILLLWSMDRKYRWVFPLGSGGCFLICMAVACLMRSYAVMIVLVLARFFLWLLAGSFLGFILYGIWAKARCS